MPLYLTEYGYFASGKRSLPTKTRSRYLKQAYTIALRNGRVKSQLQYLMTVLPRGSGSTFNTGLVTQDRQAPAAVQRARAAGTGRTGARSSAPAVRSRCRRRRRTRPAERVEHRARRRA